MINCIWVTFGECDLIFYIMQDYVAINPQTVVAIYHKLTTNYLMSYITGVEVLSHVRSEFNLLSVYYVLSMQSLSSGMLV